MLTQPSMVDCRTENPYYTSYVMVLKRFIKKVTERNLGSVTTIYTWKGSFEYYESRPPTIECARKYLSSFLLSNMHKMLQMN